MNCKEAKQIDIVSFLAKNGIDKDSIQGINYWYKSPLREERTASFKVNRYKNIWFDFGIGEGGDIVKLICMMFKVNYSDALKLLSSYSHLSHSTRNYTEDSSIKILEVKDLSNINLLNYLNQRRIDIDIAKRYCNEVTFLLNQKRYYAIGFKNNSGGFELRTKYFKGSCTPKGITLIKNDSSKVLVFEGFVDFLSWFSSPFFFSGRHDFLILNTLSFLNKSKQVMMGYPEVYLYLDNDNAGKNASNDLKGLKVDYVEDMSIRYSDFKDLNDSILNRSFGGSGRVTAR